MSPRTSYTAGVASAQSRVLPNTEGCPNPFFSPDGHEGLADLGVLRDVDGNEYIDFSSGIYVTTLGHCHPKILAAMVEQAGRLTLTSRAFRNDRLPGFLGLVLRKSLLVRGFIQDELRPAYGRVPKRPGVTASRRALRQPTLVLLRSG